MRFKVGYKVRVICADEETSTSTTRSMVGKIAKVIGYNSMASMPYTLYFEADNLRLNFMDKELEMCRKIGEQLMLFEV